MFPNSALIERLQGELFQDLLAFLPELILCGTIVLMLVLRLTRSCSRSHMGYLAIAASTGALGIAIAQWAGCPTLTPDLQHGQVFTGLLIYDAYAIYVRVFLLGFAVMTLWLSLLTGIPDAEDSADFYTLLLGSTLGMMLMTSANHLLTVFLAVEMASVPSYALAGFLKGKRRSSEAALKYVVYGASASGVMLYGISLLTAKVGSGYLLHVHDVLNWTQQVGSNDSTVAIGMLFVLVGLCFKLSAVPFHFWCPDVFEGAAAEVAAFLSVASKGAAVALTGRVIVTIAGDSQSEIGIMAGSTFGLGLIVIAAATASLGNLAALGQTNMKRLLAYSTIAHAGYMIMGLATMRHVGLSAVLFYLAAYFFMNLGAFAIVALLRNRTGSEDLRDWGGLIHREPLLVVALAVCLLSLLGLPPLAGFAAKFQVFAALYETGQAYAQNFAFMSYAFYGLLIIAGINTVISAAYYLKVLRVTVLDEPAETLASTPAKSSGIGAGFFAVVLAGMVVAVGVFWDPGTRAAGLAADSFKKPTAPPVVQPLSKKAEAKP